MVTGVVFWTCTIAAPPGSARCVQSRQLNFINKKARTINVMCVCVCVCVCVCMKEGGGERERKKERGLVSVILNVTLFSNLFQWTRLKFLNRIPTEYATLFPKRSPDLYAAQCKTLKKDQRIDTPSSLHPPYSPLSPGMFILSLTESWEVKAWAGGKQNGHTLFV